MGRAGIGLAFNRWAYRVRRRVLQRVLRLQRIEIAGARILELGFGTGFYLDLWRQLHAAHVTGFDIADAAVRDARERFAEPGWRFERGDIGAPLPFGVEAGSFDLATAFDVLFHLVEEPGWNGALDNLAAALKPGGRLVIFDKFQRAESAVGHVKRRTRAAYEQALAERGFEVLAVKPLFFFMNSPTDYSGVSKLAFKTAWSLVRLPYKLGRPVGLGEAFGAATGAALYGPELLLGRLFSSGPSTKVLVARKR